MEFIFFFMCFAIVYVPLAISMFCLYCALKGFFFKKNCMGNILWICFVSNWLSLPIFCTGMVFCEVFLGNISVIVPIGEILHEYCSYIDKDLVFGEVLHKYCNYIDKNLVFEYNTMKCLWVFILYYISAHIIEDDIVYNPKMWKSRYLTFIFSSFLFLLFCTIVLILTH